MVRAERPLDAGDSPLLRFAADLRKLREQAGSPAYRELSRRAHYSTGALSDAAAGRRLPSLAVTRAYVDACDGDPDEWERRWREVAAELDAAKSAAAESPAQQPAPYVGLAAFGAADADRFFGRDRLVAELTALVAAQRFVVVIGPSGSGKSSLLRAGLLPAKAQGAQGIAPGPAVTMTPGPHPLQECAAQLAALVGGSAATLHTALRTDQNSLHLTALQALVGQPAGHELLLVIDQFEEVFTLGHEPGERTQLLSVLTAAAKAENSRTRIVLGVRADFYAHCAQHPDLVQALRSAQVLVGPMSTDELRQAITGPAIGAGCRAETALVSQVIADATGHPGALPLVSHALLETWRRRRGTTLTLAGYQAAGGIARAIARTGESAYAALSPEQQLRARQLFLRLVALGENTEDTKRRISTSELDRTDPTTAMVLERLAAARLVTLGQDSVELTHEVLIGAWPRLRDWLSQDRESLRLHRELTEASARWQQLDRDTGALYRGTRLTLAQDLTLNSATKLTPQEQEFLHASLAAESAELAAAQRRSRRLSSLVVLLAVLLVLTMAVTGYAIRTQAQFAEQRNLAVAAKATSDAIALRTTNPGLAVQLSLAAHRIAPTTTSRNGLISALATPLAGHTQNVVWSTFSQDGRTLASASYDRTVRLWDVSQRRRPTELATVTGHTDIVTAVALSPDGRTMASTGRDRTVRLWSLADPRRPTPLATLTGHTDIIFSVVFSPDGRTLASGSYDHTVRLWNTTNPAAPTELATVTGHTLNVKPVAFSPDGRLLATGSDDQTVRLWDLGEVGRPAPLATLTGHRDFVDAVAFSPDGRTLASGSDDHTTRMWNITDPRRPVALATLNGHTDVVTSVTFSPDGTTLATTSNDQTTRLWTVSDPQHSTESAVLTGHTGVVNSVRFAPDGRTIATTSDDHTVQLWDTDAGQAEATVCALAHPRITRSEWEQYFPGLDYDPPCP